MYGNSFSLLQQTCQRIDSLPKRKVVDSVSILSYICFSLSANHTGHGLKIVNSLCRSLFSKSSLPVTVQMKHPIHDCLLSVHEHLLVFSFREMFWSDWGSPAKIEMSDMDGKNRKVLINTDIVWPNGLAIDIYKPEQSRVLYYTDANTDIIGSYDLKTKKKKVIKYSIV